MQQRLKSKWSEAEQVFHEDVREKKKAASGVHSKTGKNGYVGKMRFSYDIMSRKEKYNHRKAGKILTTNLFDTILPIDEFRQLEREEQRNRMIHWRNKFQNKEIQKGMGIANSPYYKLVDELDLPKAARTNTTKRKSAPIKQPVKQQLTLDKEFDTLQHELKSLKEERDSLLKEKEARAIAAPIENPVQEIIVDGLHLILNGTYTPEQIQKQLAKFELLLEGEEDNYYIELKLIQKKQKQEEVQEEVQEHELV